MEAATSLRLTSYNSRGRLLGDEFSGKVVIDVRLSLYYLAIFFLFLFEVPSVFIFLCLKDTVQLFLATIFRNIHPE